MACDEKEHLHKDYVKIIFFVFAVLACLVYVLTNSSDEQARLDAVDAMCRTYAHMDGGAARVSGTVGQGFFVECKNVDVLNDSFNVLIANLTVVQ